MFQYQPKKELKLNELFTTVFHQFRTPKFYVFKYDRSETSELNFGIGETVCSHGHLYTGQLSRHFLF